VARRDVLLVFRKGTTGQTLLCPAAPFPAMMEAIKIVQPALENFYGSLTDEQKARFNQLGPRPS
jgi:LTXXQ motif family protein